MVLKLFKAVWFLSLLAVLTVFMFVYASLQETVSVQEGVVLSREAFFYLVLFLLAIINVSVFIFMKLYKKETEQDFLSWILGLIIAINIFFVVALNFINLYNSNEKFEYSRLGFIIYGSIFLIMIWAIGWPLYTLGRKFLAK